MAKPTTPKDSSTLELDDDRDFERRERLLRRIGTWALCALLLAALVGLFGSGPLSQAELRSNDNAIVARYERFTRTGAATVLDLTLRAESREVAIGLNAAFVERIRIDQVAPQPARVLASGARHVYEFLAAGPDSTLHVVLRYSPETLGWLTAVVTVSASEIRFRQFVYP